MVSRMAYCEVSDVLHELHPTLLFEMRKHYDTAHGADPLQPDFEGTIAEHISKAEAFVNASLARAYRVPLKKATSVVISAECKIAAYFAAASFSEKEQILKDRYETATEILENLVKADDSSLVEEDDSSDKGDSRVSYGSDCRIFTVDELSQW